MSFAHLPDSVPERLEPREQKSNPSSSFLVEKERGGVLLVSKNELFSGWKDHLDEQVRLRSELGGTKSGRSVVGLSKATAANYRRQVGRYLDALAKSSTDSDGIFSQAPVSRTADYLDSVSAQNVRTGEVVRSIILGKFLPWAVREGKLRIDLSQFDSLCPTPFSHFSPPFFEAWLSYRFPDQSGSDRAVVAQQRMYMRGLVRFVAEKYLGADLSKYEKDARPFLLNEVAGERRMQRGLNYTAKTVRWSLQEPPYPPPYKSVSEWVHFSKKCIEDYLSHLGEKHGKVEDVKHQLSVIRKYFQFAHTQGISVTGRADIKNPFSSGPRKERSRVKKKTSTCKKKSSESSTKTKTKSSRSRSQPKQRRLASIPQPQGINPKNGSVSGLPLILDADPHESLLPNRKGESIFQYMAKRNGSDAGFVPKTTAGFEPTDALPGSEEKIEILKKRVQEGMPLWHKDDDLYLE